MPRTSRGPLDGFQQIPSAYANEPSQLLGGVPEERELELPGSGIRAERSALERNATTVPPTGLDALQMPIDSWFAVGGLAGP